MRMLHHAYVCLSSLAVVAAVLTAPAAAEPVQVSPTVDANTTALYRFKEGTGTTTACQVTGVPAGTFYGGAGWVPGREYYAVVTGPGYVRIPSTAAFNPANALTVETWVKLEQSAGDLICKNTVHMIRLGKTISAYFYIDGNWRSFSGHLPVPTGQWIHLAITYDSATTTGAIYVNGVLDTTKQFTGLTTGKIHQGISDLYIGQDDWNPSGSHVPGKVDTLRISNIARSFDPLYPPVTPPPTPPGNLVPNGDFELGLAGWRLNNEGDANLIWETVSNNVASGRQCLHSIPGATLPGDATGQSATLISRPIPASPGRHYTLSMRMKADADMTSGVSVYAAGAASGLPVQSPFPITPAVTTTWTEISQSFVLPNNFSALSLCVGISYPLIGELWVDDVRLTGGDVVGDPILQNKVAVGPQSLPVSNLYFAGTPAPTTLNVVNTDTIVHSVAVQATVADWEGKKSPAVSVGTFNVPAGGVTTTTFNIDTSRRGAFRLGFDLTSGGQTWHQSTEFKYAVIVSMKNVGDGESSMFGMNTHMEREPTPHLSRNIEALSQCGVKWIRGWWGWGMCEQTQGTFDFTEFDRQYNTVTGGTGMCIMPILLRYYYMYEQTWAGPVTAPDASNNFAKGIQQYPYTDMLPEWSIFVGKVAQRYQGQIKAYELWNEPTMGSGTGGIQTAPQYATLLNDTASFIRQYDPNAKIVAFAGVPTTFMQSVLALNTASQMDILSEHTYSQVMQPESLYPPQVATVRGIMNANDAAGKPIWDSEQGVQGDDDGYSLPSTSEADVAGLYTRNIVTAASQGESKFFWFSAQSSPTYGYAVFYENYIPRPRLTALNACASLLEGATYQRSYIPSNTTTYAHLFKGSTGVCVVWNTTTALSLSLPISASKLQAFDMMGNAIPVGGSSTKAAVPIPVRRPVYLKCAVEDYNLLDTALAGMQATNVYPVTVTARPATGGVQVTLTGASLSLIDGIVDLIPTAASKPAGWPAPQHFQSLALGQTTTLTFVVPKTTPVKTVHVSVGDRQVQDLTVPYMGL